MFDTLTMISTGTIITLVLLLNLMIWRSNSGTTRMIAATISGLFFLLIYIGINGMMSLPKPVQSEWLHRNAKEVTVLSFAVEEKRWVFLWVRLPDGIVPRSYKMPWTKKLEEQLRRQGHKAEQSKRKLKMKNPFQRQSPIEYDDKMFYPEPVRSNPPKTTMPTGTL